MTHTIYLLRHAKSSWDDPALADHDRPLAKRGRKAAALLAEHFHDAGVAPDLVLCSSAARAVETLDGIRAGLAPETRVEIDAGLYGAGAEALLQRLRALPEEVAAVMLIGHNPAIEDLATELAGSDSDSGARDRMLARYPTGGLASFSFEGTWTELKWEGASLDAFVVPKRL